LATPWLYQPKTNDDIFRPTPLQINGLGPSNNITEMAYKNPTFGGINFIFKNSAIELSKEKNLHFRTKSIDIRDNNILVSPILQYEPNRRALPSSGKHQI
jgi:hypothetical protein